MGMQRPIRLQKPGPQWSFGTKRSIVGGTTSGHAPLTRNSSLNPSLFSRPEPLQVSQRSCYCTCICLSQDFLFSILKKKSHLQIMPKKWHCFNKRIQFFCRLKNHRWPEPSPHHCERNTRIILVWMLQVRNIKLMSPSSKEVNYWCVYITVTVLNYILFCRPALYIFLSLNNLWMEKHCYFDFVLFYQHEEIMI